MPVTADWTALGTTVRLAVTAEAGLDPARRAVVEVLDAFDNACSRFRADSELSKINSADGHWTPIGPLLAEALNAALWAARVTDGAVDPTIGRALRLLGYDRDFQAIDGGHDAPLQLATVSGWQALEVEHHPARVRLPAGVELDLGATAKGLAADRAVAAALEAAGCGVLVSLGGDIAVAGEPPEGGWVVLVTDDSADATGEGDLVTIRDGGLATSSTMVRRWHRGAVELHHIIDPRTGLPVDSPWRTASVVAASCLEANAASTAAILKCDQAPDWLSRLALPARLVRSDGSVLRLAGWPG
jgi:thiamine biosynthesis lipoprotein ApbE